VANQVDVWCVASKLAEKVKGKTELLVGIHHKDEYLRSRDTDTGKWKC
jgi:hypothetical protein